MNFGILFSGCGVYDGTEIQEAVLTMLAIQEAGGKYICLAPDVNQHHVINHTNGKEMEEKRNVLIESARIARGNILPIHKITSSDIDALVLPGGFGAAKNLTSWAFDGPQSTVLPEVKKLLVDMVKAGKPICALCVSPVVLAKAFEKSSVHLELTLGTTAADSEYDIQGFSDGLKAVGVTPVMKTIEEVLVDKKNKVISAPCYMMKTDILGVRNNIKSAIKATIELMK